MKRNPILVDVAKRSLAIIQYFLYLKYCFIERKNSSIQDSIIMSKGPTLNMSPVIFITYIIFATKARFLLLLALWNKSIHAIRIDSETFKLIFRLEISLEINCLIRRICSVTTEAPTRDLLCSVLFPYHWYQLSDGLSEQGCIDRAWKRIRCDRCCTATLCSWSIWCGVTKMNANCSLLFVQNLFRELIQKSNFIYCCFIYFSFWMP